MCQKWVGMLEEEGWRTGPAKTAEEEHARAKEKAVRN